MIPRLLILGGTALARQLADALVASGSYDVETSLAGVTPDPRLPAGRLRLGGFGGPDALADYLRENKVDLLIDVTHPFAARISVNAVSAAQSAGVPLLILERSPWVPLESDRWYSAAEADAAATCAATLGRSIFVALGTRSLAPFLALKSHRLLFRTIAPLSPSPTHPDFIEIQARGPFDLAGERALLSEHSIDVVVTRNSGGKETAAKLAVARELSLPVVMIERPHRAGDLGDGVVKVYRVDAALDWIIDRFGGAKVYG